MRRRQDERAGAEGKILCVVRARDHGVDDVDVSDVPIRQWGVMEKLDVHSAAEIVLSAVRRGIVR